MILTGTHYRPFYPQSEINWISDFTPIDIRSECNFYFSGDNSLELIYKLKNNKVYSPDNELLSTYNNNESINFSGNLTRNSIDLYKNNLPLYLGKSRNSTGDLYNFKFELNIDSSINLDSVSILGDEPEYFVDNNIIYKSGSIIPINITHSGLHDIFIFSGNSNDQNFTISGANNLSIPPNQVSTIYLLNNAGFIPDQQLLSIDLYTNIGLENLFINISGEQIFADDLFYINLTPPTNTVFSNSSLTYTLSFANQSGSNIEISLEYVSGITGDYYRNVQRTGSVNSFLISGFVSGSGFINGLATGTISGFNTLRNAFEYGTGSGIFSKLRIADDGFTSVIYESITTGIGDIDFIQDVLATGYSENILYSGFVNYAGGILTGFVFGNSSGIIFDQLKTGNITGSSNRFQRWTGDILAEFLPDEYQLTPIQSPVRFVTGNFSTGLGLFGLAYATGERVSGKLVGDFGANDFEPGRYVFSKPFSGPVTGSTIEFTGFNPVDLSITETTTTGLFQTILQKEIFAQGCEIKFGEEEEALRASGIPLNVTRLDPKGTGITFPVEIFQTVPLQSNIESAYENSEYKISSGESFLSNQIKYLYSTGFLKSGNVKNFVNTGLFPTMAVDEINDNIYITRQNGDLSLSTNRISIYNPLYQSSWNDNSWCNNDLRFTGSPAFTLWNKDGWNTRTGLHSRNYTGFYNLFSESSIFPNNATNFRNSITGKELVMWDFLSDKYYAVKFLNWSGSTSTNNRFQYERSEITGNRVATLDNFEYKYNVRTNISRLGLTPYGKGVFDNIFQVPFFTGGYLSGLINSSGNIINFDGIDVFGQTDPGSSGKFSTELATWGKNFYGWKENIDSFIDDFELTGQPNILTFVSGSYDLYGKEDFSLLDFQLTGSANDLFNDIAFTFDLEDTGRYIVADLYKKNSLSGRTYTANKIFSGSGLLPVDNKIFSGTGSFSLVTGVLYITTGNAFGFRDDLVQPFPNITAISGDFSQIDNIISGSFITPNGKLFISPTQTGVVIFSTGGIFNTGVGICTPFPNVSGVSGDFSKTGSLISGSFTVERNLTGPIQGGGTVSYKEIFLFNSPKNGNVILQQITGGIPLGIVKPDIDESINSISGNLRQVNSIISGNFKFGTTGFRSPDDAVVLLRSTGSRVVPINEYLISGQLNTTGNLASGIFVTPQGLTIISNSNMPNSTGVYLENLGVNTTIFLESFSGGFHWFDTERGSRLIGEKELIITNVNNLRTGDYFWKTYFKDASPSGVSPSGVTPIIGLSYTSYTGCEKDRIVVFAVKKLDNYKFYSFSGELAARFSGPNFPNTSQKILRDGLKWTFAMDENVDTEYFAFYIFQGNTLQVNWGGLLNLTVNNSSFETPDPFVKLSNTVVSPQSAQFTIIDDDSIECCGTNVCSSTEPPRPPRPPRPPDDPDDPDECFGDLCVGPPDDPNFITVGPIVGPGSLGPGPGAGPGGTIGAGPGGGPGPGPGPGTGPGAGPGAGPGTGPDGLGPGLVVTIGTSSSSTPSSRPTKGNNTCAEVPNNIRVQINGEVVCSPPPTAFQEYYFIGQLCLEGIQCEDTGFFATITVNGKSDRSSGRLRRNNPCTSTLRISLGKLGIGQQVSVFGSASGNGNLRIGAEDPIFDINGNEVSPGAQGTLLRNQSIQARAGSQSFTTEECACCPFYGDYIEESEANKSPNSICEENNKCPQYAGNYDCAEGSRGCYKCIECAGCTNPNSPNFNSEAKIDDGTCETCAGAGNCYCAGDNNCSGISNGCCDCFCETTAQPRDCSPTFRGSFTALNGTFYPACQCPTPCPPPPE